MLNRHVLAENLVNIYVLNAESGPDTPMEYMTTGAVFSLVRVLHQIGEFDHVVRLAAAQLEIAPDELASYLPGPEEAADFRELFESVLPGGR